MTAERQDFDMNEGETKRLVAPRTEDEDEGGDLDIGGYQELTWFLKTREGGSVIVEKKESDSLDVKVTDTAVGAYVVRIDPEDTNGELNRQKDTFFHKVRLKDADGNISDLAQGTVTIDKA